MAAPARNQQFGPYWGVQIVGTDPRATMCVWAPARRTSLCSRPAAVSLRFHRPDAEWDNRGRLR